MSETRRTGPGRRIIGGLTGFTLTATLAAALLFAFDQPTAAAVVATATAMLWLLLIIVVTSAVASWWTAKTMEAGAEIALRAQEINDQWDARKANALAGVFKAGVQAERQTGTTPLANASLPALPWETGNAPVETWPPPLQAFDAPDIANTVDVEEGKTGLAP